MNERESWNEVEAALRREFSPPALDALNERVAKAAAEAKAVGMQDVAAQELPASTVGWRVPLAVALAVAAAVTLVWVLGAGTEQAAVEPGPIAAAPGLVAGAQLDGFLARGAVLPADDGSCAEPVVPLSCADEGPVPQLLVSAEVTLVGECNSAGGIDCALYDLPAQRALLVRLNDHDEDVIVCIEPPWADPRPVLPSDSRYNIFRRTLGEYILYEITPLSTAVAVDHLALVAGG